VPPDRLDEAVDVLAQLPGEAALADSGGPGDRHEAGPPVASDCVQGVLEGPQFLGSADEGRLEDVGAAAPLALGDDGAGPPGRHRR
jgi:hypothetical protein